MTNSWQSFRDRSHASIKILKKEGAHALSLREVARVAGVSHAAPYRHFQDKEALLAAIAHPEHFRLMFGGFIQDSERFEDLNAEARKSFAFLESAIDQCQKAHQIKAGDSAKYAIALWSMVHGHSMLLIDGTFSHLGDLVKSPEKSVDQFIDFLMDGIRGQSSRSTGRSK